MQKTRGFDMIFAFYCKNPAKTGFNHDHQPRVFTRGYIYLTPTEFFDKSISSCQ